METLLERARKRTPKPPEPPVQPEKPALISHPLAGSTIGSLTVTVLFYFAVIDGPMGVWVFLLCGCMSTAAATYRGGVVPPFFQGAALSLLIFSGVVLFVVWCFPTVIGSMYEVFMQSEPSGFRAPVPLSDTI